MASTAQGDDAASFMTLLRSFRLRAGLTQEELSEGSGISVRAISDMERGIAKHPQRRTVELLAAPLALGEEELTQLKELAKRVPGRRDESSARTGIFDTPRTRMLPPDVDDLTGRATELAALHALVVDLADGRRRSGHVAVVSGSPGTGKTTLVVRAAHDLAGHFPDGRFFLRLRGMSSRPDDPADVLHQLLRSLGVDAVRVPPDLDERADLCRSLLVERAALLVFDEAADEAQVRPLLVGGPRCLTLVTSRQMLVGLEGVDRLSLDALKTGEAVEVLAAILGAERVAAEPDAATELVELCGRLPLALRIAGNRLASRPHWPLTHLVEQLRDHNRRLTALTAGDLDVRSVFELSYQQLDDDAAKLLRRLSLIPAPDFSVEAAEELLDAERQTAGSLLEDLTDASLLHPAPQRGRYQFHPLLRAFAAERLSLDEDPQAVESAERRLARWLTQTATAAGRYFQPSDEVHGPLAVTPSFRDHATAQRWLEIESVSWLSALRQIAANGEHQAVLDLAEAMHWYSELGGTASMWQEVFELAVASALSLGSRRDEAVHRNYLSWVHGTLVGRSEEAVRLAGLALEAATEAGDLREQGWARLYLANASRNGDISPARELFDDAVVAFEEAAYAPGLHVARMMRATHMHAEGQLAEAAAEFAVSVRYFGTLREASESPIDDTGYAYLLLPSARNLASLEQDELALSQLEESLRLFRLHDAAMGEARALNDIGVLLRKMQQPALARARLDEAAELYERIGMIRNQASALCDIAELSDQLGDAVAAQRDRARAMSLCDRLGGGADPRLRARLSEHVRAS